jgi:Protein of unknown function (DUF3037)
MSAELCPYDYAVLRLVPRVEREEFVNAGVILFARQRGFLDVLVDREARLLARAEALHGRLERAPLIAALRAWVATCRGEAQGGPIAGLPQSERFHWLTTPRSTLLQPSTVHSGLAEDPAETLKRLLHELVLD